MPSRDATGKRLSGAAQARKKKAAVEHERTRIKSAGGAFASLPPPPIDDTAALITWGAKALAMTLDRAMRDSAIFETERDQLRFVADGCAKLGMIRDKAVEQDKIRKALHKEKKAAETAGLTDASQRGTPRVSRPPG